MCCSDLPVQKDKPAAQGEQAADSLQLQPPWVLLCMAFRSRPLSSRAAPVMCPAISAHMGLLYGECLLHSIPLGWPRLYLCLLRGTPCPLLLSSIFPFTRVRPSSGQKAFLTRCCFPYPSVFLSHPPTVNLLHV